MNYEAVIGLEVHLQLKTKTKAFCGCSTEFGQGPNSQVCPVCLGFPGSLPVFNRTVLDYALKVALALNCKIQEYTKFDRKNYFYPDLPKNYQISQYDLPLSRDGFLEMSLDGVAKHIGITRVHMEEDAGKLIHHEDGSYVDFNRTGIPLLEIVSEPDIRSPEEAYEYLSDLKAMIQYLEVSDCDMEKGSLRCDANISLRPKGAKALGVKAELKNMNSFKGVKDALAYEINRQSILLDAGQAVIQETRLWDARANQTLVMRTKEGAKDYRYFPEPDLAPLVIEKDKVAQVKKSIPELPKEKTQRFVKDYALSEYDAKILAATKSTAQFAEECLKKFEDTNKKPVANWIIGPLAALAGSKGCAVPHLGISIEGLIALIDLVEKKQVISNITGKFVLEEMINTGKSAQEIISEKKLAQLSDPAGLGVIIEEVINQNPKSVIDYQAGKANALMYLVGQVMRKSQGKANPKICRQLLEDRLGHA